MKIFYRLLKTKGRPSVQLLKEKKSNQLILTPVGTHHKSSLNLFDSIDHTRLIQTFLDLVRISSPSGDEEELRHYIESRLLQLKMDYHVDQAGNLIAFKEGRLRHNKTILLNAHMDTVSAGKVINPIVGDDFITTDGESILGADDKAGIAAILEALEILSSENQFQFDHLKVIFTVSEETGLKGAKALSEEDLKADYGFVLDGDGVPGTIYHRGPTQEVFEVKVNGRAAHAGLNPDKGIHALQIAAAAIAELKLGLIDPETVCNVGEFHAGKGTNIIPETAVVRGEVRSHDEAKLNALKQKITKAFQNATRNTGATFDMNWDRMFDRVYLSKNAEPIQAAVRAAEALSLPAKVISSNGGSDACIFNARGIPTTVLGVGFEKAHSTKEQIKVSNLVKMTALLVETIHQAAVFREHLDFTTENAAQAA